MDEILLLLKNANTEKFFGVLPVDITLHFFGGLILTLILLRFKLKLPLVFVIVLFIGILKEYNDSFIMGATTQEALEDLLFTILFPIFLFPWRFLKKKMDD